MANLLWESGLSPKCCAPADFGTLQDFRDSCHRDFSVSDFRFESRLRPLFIWHSQTTIHWNIYYCNVPHFIKPLWTMCCVKSWQTWVKAFKVDQASKVKAGDIFERASQINYSHPKILSETLDKSSWPCLQNTVFFIMCKFFPNGGHLSSFLGIPCLETKSLFCI